MLFVRANINTPGYANVNHNPRTMRLQTEWRTVDDVANVVLFLLSDAARFITGQAINVDGGESYHLAIVTKLCMSSVKHRVHLPVSSPCIDKRSTIDEVVSAYYIRHNM